MLPFQKWLKPTSYNVDDEANVPICPPISGFFFKAFKTIIIAFHLSIFSIFFSIVKFILLLFFIVFSYKFCFLCEVYISFNNILIFDLVVFLLIY